MIILLVLISFIHIYGNEQDEYLDLFDELRTMKRLSRVLEHATQPGPNREKGAHMSQVNTLIAPAWAERHPQSSTSCPKGPFRTPVPVADSDAEQPVGDALIPIPPIRRLPHRAAMDTRSPVSSAVLVGEAGTSLVLSRLLAWGIGAQPAMQGAAYDIIADVPGFDMLRIQVKTRTGLVRGQCIFTMNRGFRRSRKGFFRYTATDFDLAAFVYLPLEKFFFFPGPVSRISVRASWLRVPGIDRDTLELALGAIRCHRQSEMLSWLASMTGEHRQADIPAQPVATPALQLAFGF
ncbi:MAG: group I intron-associated PD-(D/E)XK endonuclease [Acidobacteriota bacterium]